jgi:hypothetical protein
MGFEQQTQVGLEAVKSLNSNGNGEDLSQTYYLGQLRLDRLFFCMLDQFHQESKQDAQEGG